jgi:hypothetical protein
MFEIEELSEENKGSYHTMGGFVITNLGKNSHSSRAFLSGTVCA